MMGDEGGGPGGGEVISTILGPLVRRYWRKPYQALHIARKWKVVRGKENAPDRKMVILVPKEEGGEFFETSPLLAFPQPRHIQHFFRATEGLRADSPGRSYPGHVGSMGLQYTPGNKFVTLKYLQGGYQKGGPFPNKLHHFYHGWQMRLMLQAIGEAHRIGRPLMIPKSVIDRHPLLIRRTLKRCGELGIKWERSKGRIEIHP